MGDSHCRVSTHYTLVDFVRPSVLVRLQLLPWFQEEAPPILPSLGRARLAREDLEIELKCRAVPVSQTDLMGRVPRTSTNRD